MRFAFALSLLALVKAKYVNDSIFDSETLLGGGFILYAIGLSIPIIKVKEDLYRPIVYCLLNSIVFLIIALCSTLDNNSYLGVTTILGSDFLNIFLIFGVILYRRFSDDSMVDNWLFFRDILYYLLGLGILITFFFLQNDIFWYYGFVLIIYYILFYFVQSKNDFIKEKVYRILGLTHEDDSFNADEHFSYKKRRDSLTNLSECGFVNKQEPALIKKLNRTEAILLINLKDNHDKYKVYSNFQRLVYIIIFSLRAKIRLEKQKRSEFYAGLHSKAIDNKSVKSESEREQLSEKEKPLDLQLDEPNEFKSAENENQKPFEISKDQGSDNDQDNNQISNFQGNTPNYNYNDDLDSEEDEEYEVSLKWPAKFSDRLIHAFTFPILFLLYFIPNYKKSPTVKKLAFSMLLNISLLTGLIFILNRLLHVTAYGMRMENETMGYLFSAYGFTFPFYKYNIKIASNDKDVDFMQSFLQLGIFKIGICIGCTWLLACITKLTSSIDPSPIPFRLGLSIVFYVGFMFLLLLAVMFNRFRLTYKISYIYLFLLVCFYISIILVLEI